MIVYRIKHDSLQDKHDSLQETPLSLRSIHE